MVNDNYYDLISLLQYNSDDVVNKKVESNFIANPPDDKSYVIRNMLAHNDIIPNILKRFYPYIIKRVYLKYYLKDPLKWLMLQSIKYTLHTSTENECAIDINMLSRVDSNACYKVNFFNNNDNEVLMYMRRQIITFIKEKLPKTYDSICMYMKKYNKISKDDITVDDLIKFNEHDIFISESYIGYSEAVMKQELHDTNVLKEFAQDMLDMIEQFRAECRYTIEYVIGNRYMKSLNDNSIYDFNSITLYDKVMNDKHHNNHLINVTADILDLYEIINKDIDRIFNDTFFYLKIGLKKLWKDVRYIHPHANLISNIVKINPINIDNNNKHFRSIPYITAVDANNKNYLVYSARIKKSNSPRFTYTAHDIIISEDDKIDIIDIFKVIPPGRNSASISPTFGYFLIELINNKNDGTITRLNNLFSAMLASMKQSIFNIRDVFCETAKIYHELILESLKEYTDYTVYEDADITLKILDYSLLVNDKQTYMLIVEYVYTSNKEYELIRSGVTYNSAYLLKYTTDENSEVSYTVEFINYQYDGGLDYHWVHDDTHKRIITNSINNILKKTALMIYNRISRYIDNFNTRIKQVKALYPTIQFNGNIYDFIIECNYAYNIDISNNYTIASLFTVNKNSIQYKDSEPIVIDTEYYELE